MKTRVKDPANTRERLLEAAGAAFAAKGYRAATVAEICRRARANVAAVNYHFGSKERLYAESWHHEFRKSLAAHPMDGGVPAAAPVEERLRGRVLAMLRRILDPKSRDFDILHKELAAPTGLLAEVKRQGIESVRQGMGAIVREILGPGASDDLVRLCQSSIISQCLGPMIRERRRRLTRPGRAAGRPLDVPLEVLAEHITRFSLAGIRDAAARPAPGRPRKTSRRGP